jgi:uncharacterized Rmd1/YagE family protein
MKIMDFKAYAITHEIDLNKIAIKCGIPKKYTWEEPLILQGEILNSILQSKIYSDLKVLVFSFGSIVYINFSQEDIMKFMEYIKSFKPDIDIKNYNRYTEEYELIVDEKSEIEFSDEYVTVNKYEQFYAELISTVIAKSVALEKTEEQLGKILDVLEGTIDRLERGNLGITDKELAKTTARIVKHEYNTIAYIMILDKPDITWTNIEAGEFYNLMSEFFELNDRYEILKRKTEILNNIMNGFSSLKHSTRGMFVEWIVVILIIIEVVLMVVELVK